jgi:CheY-like chemotaxis protein
MYKKVLLIDDDEDEQFFFTEALKEIGAPVKLFFAPTANEGIKLLKFLLPDIVFMDINMPALSGFDCLEIIKCDTRISKIPIIIYSTGINEVVFREALKKGAFACMKKQDTIKELAFALREIFGVGVVY